MMGLLLSLVAIFLILLVLVQRGRGGGLAGALGGMGGSSAFGAKAGDVFTRVTSIAAMVWILLCIAASRWGSSSASRIDVGAESSQSVPAADVAAPPAKGEKSDATAVETKSEPAAATMSAEKSPAAPANNADASDAQPATTGSGESK